MSSRALTSTWFRWEHDPAWAYTSKLLISKHQQVQLLEAASVLVNMNLDEPNPSEGVRHAESDVESSASPPASGSSEHPGEYSSTETTPPPMSEVAASMPKRYSSASSGYSQSVTSAAPSVFAGSAPSGPNGFFYSPDYEQRPSTSGTSYGNPMSETDEAGLAAAVELCNFGTPRTGPVHMQSDIPPVPPLPARYMGQSLKSPSSLATPTMYNPLGMQPPSFTQQISQERDVKMDHEPIPEAEDDDRQAYNQDEDEGFFGQMEQ